MCMLYVPDRRPAQCGFVCRQGMFDFYMTLYTFMYMYVCCVPDRRPAKCGLAGRFYCMCMCIVALP